MTYRDFTPDSTIVPGDTLIRVQAWQTQYGSGVHYEEMEVLAVEETRIQVANPDGGNYRSNKNRSARTRWYKRTSPILAGRVIRSA